MDVQTGLICIGIVVISAAAILCISVFSIRETSYEEAIAEQRKLPDDLLSNKKDKNKEKKHKNKAGKKVKEKKEEKEDKEDKDEKPDHVQFEETPQILPPEPPVQESNKGNKKKGKLEKIKPILINKDEPLVFVSESSSSQPPLAEANHFDLTHPKDDFELVRSHSKENLQQTAHAETVEKVNKSPKDTPTKTKKHNKDVKKKDESSKEEKQDANIHTNASSTNKEVAKEAKEQQKETPVKEVKEVAKEVTIPQLSNKESKKMKKKNDLVSQIDSDAVNVELLMLCIKKAELSRSEIQILTDQLLNKQQDNPVEHSEWTEGRADPVIKLKKQLAEKEKALIDEHEASVNLQNKLKEMRNEFTTEKSRLTATIRQLEESLNCKITENQTLNTRMQHILETHAAEKQGFARQIEQLQTKVSEDTAIIHKLQEDQGQTQGHLQQELMAQRKQMEVQFAQIRDNENALKVQLTQKHVEVQELQNELQATVDSSATEMEMMRQQMGMMQTQLVHTESQLQHFKETNDQLQDIARQLEDSRRIQADLEHRLKNGHRHEQELQKQLNSLQAELNVSKSEAHEAATLKAELGKTQAELMKLKSELSVSINEAKSEAAEITALKTTLTNKDEELKKFHDLLNVVQNDLQQSTAHVTLMESKLKSVQMELDGAKNDYEKAERNLKETKNETNKYQSEVQTLQETLAATQAELAKARTQIRQSNEIAAELKALQSLVAANELQNNESKSIEAQIESMKTFLQEENDRLGIEVARKREILEKHKEQDINADVLPVANENLSKELATLSETLARKEEELKNVDERLHRMESEAKKCQRLVVELQEALEVQKSKNNDLRSKNWKAMEALDAAESRAKLSNEKNEQTTTQKVKEQQEEITKTLLQRIFPEIKVSDKTYEQWLKTFESEVCVVLNKLKQENQSTTDLENQNKSLQDMVTHYKKIIFDTETMLTKLQNQIESEETSWQSLLQQKDSEIANLRVEFNTLQTKLSSSEELKQKVKELESRLEQNSAEISHVASLKTNSSFKELDSKDLAALEQLQEEKARLSQELEVECNKRATLDAEVTKLRSLVETSEERLVCEKDLVTQLQQEVSQLKNEICGGCSSSDQSILNGPPTSDSLQSESVNLASQSEQAIENSSLTTNHSSKSCHMTDHRQANGKPLNGQQQNKSKKKKKKKGGSGKK
ncbi:ribosome-binding protein 1 isoform X4 [Pseudomyrmex gracilis]|uniref:ribosome-binding protein 1 isoform X4 n=1 Tax=Pseudomyrmex gracilis TaxID=219809 RepID=UPI0009958FB0|nr:ribosome-binding protein 1 isoform X4 [Pseudomyrmex gracilis]